ncbi:translation initiation factor eIF-2B subunit epsilon-like isoform X2 [Gigantopelta aegis]|uniref:translation initiation factor eIF-2B subunit epsilon-like isoform X2 n=1 Tax=Gigantopelta aegis TaxID=1735272 RepID=UPI001B887439|nr:translation initiation factor eIF-2B subunit epsilon-like isoform X2 [Gigantopelta aegis]
MAPKGKTNRREDLKQEDIVQAVVIADSFNVRFGPVTRKHPRTLLPLVNVPLLDYTLEFLAASSVQEVFVFCCHLADQIRTHIKNSKWSDSGSPMTVTPVLSDGCLSVGDALREIDAKSLIRSDFILVSGDLVSNINLKTLLDDHKKRREKEKSSVMTMVYKKAPPGHHSRCQDDDVILAIEKPTGQLVHFQNTQQEKKYHIPVDVFLEHQDVEIRYDLMDCQICICTPLVPQLFTDNFDYQTRDDFVRGLLINEEILGNTIHIGVVKDQYAARVSNLQMYDSVSRDVVSRWSFPLVPDNHISSSDKDRLIYGRHNIYLSRDVTLARGCTLEENVVIGSGSTIGSNSSISNSVIGKNCKIGENVTISGSYLWDDVVVHDNCVIETALLCSGVTILGAVTVNPGCVLSWNVCIGPDVKLKVGTQLMSEPDVDEFDGPKDPATIPDVTPEFGIKSKAFSYADPCESDDEEEIILSMWGIIIESEEEEELSSLGTGSEDNMSQSDSPPPDDTKLFYSELLDTLQRAKEENIGVDNQILEVNSLKHAYNIAINDVHVMLVKSLLDLLLKESGAKESNQLLTYLKPFLKKHLGLLKNYIRSSEGQLDCLQAIEEFSIESVVVKHCVVKIIKQNNVCFLKVVLCALSH